jgi:glycolate oxidase FAD binding subunit
MTMLAPGTAEELRQAVAWALGEAAPLEIVGSGSKRGLGGVVQARATLDLSRLSGLTLYEPEELVLSALPATPLAEVEATLAERGQEFAFEPPDLSALLAASGSGTLGGMVAANLSGPRRIKAGAVRDHFLGFSAVSGRGEAFQAGARVMKNVTGYDLPKLLAGSWGTLAVLSSVTLKVMPSAETQATVLLTGLDDAAAIRAMSAAMRSACDVSGAAHLPLQFVRRSKLEALRARDRSATLLRLEGIAPSVAAREAALRALLSDFGAADALDAETSTAIWREIRDVRLLDPPPEGAIWRISVAPSKGAGTLAAIRAACAGEGFYDWAGGLLWVETPPAPDAFAAAVRNAIPPASGHATLVRAPFHVRAAVAVFHPQPQAAAALNARVKDAFDPAGILNPGRMRAASPERVA